MSSVYYFHYFVVIIVWVPPIFNWVLCIPCISLGVANVFLLVHPVEMDP